MARPERPGVPPQWKPDPNPSTRMDTALHYRLREGTDNKV